MAQTFSWWSGPAGDPVRERSRQLFAYVTASEHRVAPRAALLADAIQDTLLPGAAPGAAIGSETDLTLRFGVGRRLARQASRVLQDRGVLSARRGVGGGLIVRAPGLAETAQALGASLRLHSTGQGLVDLRRYMAPLARTAGGGLGQLLQLALDLVDGRGDNNCAPLPAAWRSATRLAERLTADFALDAERADDAFLGSLDALAERYDTNRESVVQAVRLLEDAGSIRLVRGRGGGVRADRPSHASVARRVHAFLLRQGTSVEQCDALLRAINVHLIELACERANGMEHGALVAGLQGMERQSSASAVGLHWFLLQRCISDAAASGGLHLLARCLSGFILLGRLRSAELSDAHAHELIAASTTIVRNIGQRCHDASLLPHERCQIALQGRW